MVPPVISKYAPLHLFKQLVRYSASFVGLLIVSSIQSISNMPIEFVITNPACYLSYALFLLFVDGFVLNHSCRSVF